MTGTIEQRFERLAPAAHALVALAQGEKGGRMASEIDTADVSPCPKCGEPVRRFSTTRWDRGGRESHEPWWCATCLQAKCVAARAGAPAVVDVELPEPTALSSTVLSIHWPQRHVTAERAKALRAVLDQHPGVDTVEVHSTPGQVVRLPVKVNAHARGLRRAVSEACEVQGTCWAYDTSELFE